MKAYIRMIEETTSKIVVSDTAEKEFFMELYGELKDGDTHEVIMQTIKDSVSELVVQRQLITILNMARDYIGSKLFTRILDMRWYNLKALVALIRYINKEHGTTKVALLKRRITNVGKKAVGAEYNNKLAELIIELKKEYKVVITDDTQVLTKSVTSMYKGLTDIQKKELLLMLHAEFDVTEEVAA